MKDPFLLKGETCKLCHLKNHVAWCSFLWGEWKAVFPQYENSSSSSQSPYQISELIPIVTQKTFYRNTFWYRNSSKEPRSLHVFDKKSHSGAKCSNKKKGLFDIENLDKKPPRWAPPAKLSLEMTLQINGFPGVMTPISGVITLQNKLERGPSCNDHSVSLNIFCVFCRFLDPPQFSVDAHVGTTDSLNTAKTQIPNVLWLQNAMYL